MERTFDILQSRMKQLFWKIAEEKESITVDGVPGYNSKAQFTNGKVICEAAYAACQLLTPDEKQKGMAQLREIIRFTSRMPFETWGILYAIEGLYRLRQRNLLDQAADEETMERLKAALDWRSFVDTGNDFALIGKPTNYYGVAFGIARYRELMAWEPVGFSQVLLDHLLVHITRYSGEYGFMDETMGGGRYDRYSILIPAGFADETRMERNARGCTVHIHQKGFVRSGIRPIAQEPAAEISTEYVFEPGKITRRDTIQVEPELLPEIVSVRLQCEMLSGRVQADGYDLCTEEGTEEICLDTPHGRCKKLVQYEKQHIPENGMLQLNWVYQY